jgi:hypothetical protein
MNVLRAAVLAGASMLAVCPQAWGCGEALRGPTSRIESARYELVFAAMPEPIAAGKHFSLDIAVCSRAGAEMPKTLRVDATMPEHRHGMNYLPVVVSRGPGRYRADGLMFHMPGRWDVYFDVVTSAGSERLTAIKHIE